MVDEDLARRPAEQQGLLEVEKRHIRILDLEALARLVEIRLH